MTSAGHVEITQQVRGEVSAPIVLGLWFVGLGLLLVGIGNAPVTRTQEARVLETARQMLGTSVSGWLAPMLNGEPRMKKPPLCYWMAAAAFHFGGVSEAVGRVPTAVLGWLTLGLTFIFTRRLFDQRTALVSCAALLGSYYFYRFSRVAETDPAVMFFVTLAIYLVFRSTQSRNLIWPHLTAIAMALAILTKGAPGLFVLIFLLGYCAIERRWDVAKRFLVSGAPVTLLIIAAPWFYYAADVAASEMTNTLRGGDHFGWPWYYIPTLFVATAPWPLVLPLALVEAFRRWRSDPAIRIVLLWFLSILLPLCVNGNKQNHYLVMLLPPLMILIGHLLANIPAVMEKWIAASLWLTAIACGVGGAVAPVLVSSDRGGMIPIDWIVAAATGLTAIAIAAKLRRGLPRAIPVTLGLAALLMPIVIGFWVPTIDPHTARESAREIELVYGDGPFVFVGPNSSLTLCFHMKQAIPTARTIDELLAISRPGTVAIAIAKNDTSPPALPEQFEYRMKIDSGNQTLALYQFKSP